MVDDAAAANPASASAAQDHTALRRASPMRRRNSVDQTVRRRRARRRVCHALPRRTSEPHSIEPGAAHERTAGTRARPPRPARTAPGVVAPGRCGPGRRCRLGRAARATSPVDRGRDGEARPGPRGSCPAPHRAERRLIVPIEASWWASTSDPSSNRCRSSISSRVRMPVRWTSRVDRAGGAGRPPRAPTARPGRAGAGRARVGRRVPAAHPTCGLDAPLCDVSPARRPRQQRGLADAGRSVDEHQVDRRVERWRSPARKSRDRAPRQRRGGRLSMMACPTPECLQRSGARPGDDSRRPHE